MPFLILGKYNKMNVTEQKIDDLNAIIKINIATEDYKNQYEKSLKNYGKQMNIPGFRAGKVPTSLVKKKYGPSILAEEVNKLISDALHNHITENKLDVLGNPLPKEDEQKDIDWANPTDMEFVYEIGLAPEVTISVDGKLKLKYEKIKVDDKVIDKQADDFGRRYGKLVSVDKSSEKDMILGQFVQLDDKGEVLEGGITHSSTVAVEMLEDKAAKKQFTGLKVSDVVKVNPKKISRGDADMGAMLGVSAEEAAKIDSDFNFTVTEVKQMEPAELNAELFDKIYGEGNITNETEFRDRIKTDLEQMFSKDTDRLFKKVMSDELVKKAKLTLPDEFLKRWIKASNEKELSIEEIDADYENYSNQLKWQLIENKIIKDNDIKVENDEIIASTKELIINNYAQYGMPAPDDDTLTANATEVLKNQEEARRIYEMVYQDKVVTFVKETAKLDEKEISYDDFVKKYAN